MRFRLTNYQTEVLSDLFTNLSSGWFGIILISPGIFGIPSLGEFLKVLTINLPFGILSLVMAGYLKEKSHGS